MEKALAWTENKARHQRSDLKRCMALICIGTHSTYLMMWKGEDQEYPQEKSEKAVPEGDRNKAKARIAAYWPSWKAMSNKSIEHWRLLLLFSAGLEMLSSHF